MEFKCHQCGGELRYADQICPQCGSRFISLKEEIVLDDSQYGYKKKDKKRYKSKKHPYYETAFLRHEASKDLDGEIVERYKSEDRLRNWYKEFVRRKNGEIIHSCEEPLTDHRGHGSAKGGKKT